VFFYSTAKGVVRITARADRWHVYFQEEDLGSYHSAEAAAGDVAGGHTFVPSDGTDLSDLGIPADITEWRVSRPSSG